MIKGETQTSPYQTSEVTLDKFSAWNENPVHLSRLRRLAIFATSREHSQIERIKKLSDEYALESKVAQKVLRVVMDEVVKRRKAFQAKRK